MSPAYADGAPRDQNPLDEEERKAYQTTLNVEGEGTPAESGIKVDHPAESVHELDQRVVTAGRQADRVVALAADRLKERKGVITSKHPNTSPYAERHPSRSISSNSYAAYERRCPCTG
ncbi:hypothetical protein CONLIGDRAFT_686927 [Coniochaeta ligniaria NRRL 30616]|uniref:Uncharacterized protein n=1 Tax=Coniochaeta ligniaria NRRL 30616 TaxID=1408157 RepID=A0A1J7I729_9PEZI|nr:hypothetical protein CONLIGDRAFT_686927 [Coniochaeta ligniaria NRRL 30616]